MIQNCEGCNLSVYNQSLDFKFTGTTAEKRGNPSDDSLELFDKKAKDKSWNKFEKLLESDKSWEFRDPDA